MAKIENLEICLTTNGVLLENHLGSLLNLGIKNVNLSLDSLDSERFFKITRRNDFDQVYRNLMRMIEANFIVKLNAVVMHGMNDADILPLVNFTKSTPFQSDLLRKCHLMDRDWWKRNYFGIIEGYFPI